jgi:hypothetical protein
VITAAPPNRFSIVSCAARASATPPTPSPVNMANETPMLTPQHRAQPYDRQIHHPHTQPGQRAEEQHSGAALQVEP